MVGQLDVGLTGAGVTGGQVDTRSVLFTDLVASTELRVRLGEDAAEAVRRCHDQLVRDAVTAHAGAVVKGLGDGVLATFGSAADAVAAAVAVQQSVDLHARREPERAFDLRVGVSVGDVTSEADDVFGVPVVEASRLCSFATGGEILVAELVRALSRGRGGYVFEPMGSLDLKGLPEAVPACRVVWESLTTDAAGDSVPLPGALVGGASTGYVGRSELRGLLEDRWGEAVNGSCRTVLLAGEPGIGKTRTATELARVAHGEGAVVLFGRCEEELGVPYQPFVEALDWYTAHAGAPALGRFGGELARLLPDLRTRVPGLPAPMSSDPRSEEHRLLEAVASWLVQASEPSGLVLVLDDLHWATKPTLLMLLHSLRAATSTDSARLIVLGTYRDTDIDRRHPLSGLLGELRRLPGVERLAVDGLSATEVLALVELAAGHDLDEDGRRLAGTVHEETEGNPFFVAEVLRHLIETGMVRREADRWVVTDLSHMAVPEGVRDVVGRRLSRLSPTANEVLAVASVIGRSVSVDVLVTVGQATEDEVLDAVDEAVRSRLLEEVGAERYRFAHALVRSTLYEELSATRRRRLHRGVAAALEKLHKEDVAALAYHSVEAGPEGDDLSRAVAYVLAAAERAQTTRALAEAESQYRLALELLDDAELDDPAQRVAALCGLGECQRDQGEATYRGTLLDAAGKARADGELKLLVRAVLANTRGMTSVVGAVDAERVAITEAALEAIGSDPSPDRAHLLAHLAGEVVFTGDDDRRLALADEAETLARSLDDPALLGSVLVRTAFAAITGDRWRRLRLSMTEAVELADRAGDPALRAIARIWSAGATLTAGDVSEWERTANEGLALAEEASPSVRWMTLASSVRTLALRGRLAEAEQRNAAALALGTDVGEGDAPMWWAAAGVQIAWIRGDLSGWADASGSVADEYPLSRAWRVSHAWCLAEAGRLDEARDVITRYGPDPLELLRDPFPFNAGAVLARTSHRLGDRGLAQRTLVTLEPYCGCWTHFHLGSIGPVTSAMGMCALALGDHRRAVELLGNAVETVTKHRCEGIAPRLRLDLAEALVGRDEPDDRERAAGLLDQVRTDAERLDAPALAARADALGAAG